MCNSGTEKVGTLGGEFVSHPNVWPPFNIYIKLFIGIALHSDPPILQNSKHILK
jgi:hypothetical protein